jgi:hypothetical protein
VLAQLDGTAVISASTVFKDIQSLESAVTENATFAKALVDPFSVDPPILASLAEKAKTDGLLWIGREYRIRAMPSFKGNRYATWTGEILSHLYVFDRPGHLVLRVAWLDESATQYQGEEISAEQAIPLLTNAMDRAANTAASILGQAAAGKGILQGLRDESKVETSQEASNFAHEAGAFARVLLLLILIVISWSAFTSPGVVAKVIGLLFSAGVLYLLAGRGWWKDAVLQLLDFVKEAIFG